MTTDTFATMGDAHREWHRNTGVPMGTPGCPQDACHPVEDEDHGDPACPICEGTGWDEAFGNACDCAAHLAAGGARRMQHQRTIAVGGKQDRIHTPGERMDGRTWGAANAPAGPTAKQQAYAERLLAEVYAGNVEKIAQMTARFATLDKRAASKGITNLEGMRDRNRAAAAQAPTAPAAAPAAPVAAANALDLSALPAGRYAVPGGDTRLKLHVDRPTEGKWAGWTFVKDAAVYGKGKRYGKQRPEAGATYYGDVQDALRAILADPMAASAAYGHLTSHCGVCGRPLEQADSVARGIGPDCFANMGW